jgi:methionyl-tRNA synthetase
MAQGNPMYGKLFCSIDQRTAWEGGPFEGKCMGPKIGWIACWAIGIVLLAGCGNGERDATEAAINAAQSAVNAVQADAEKYVPEELAAARNALKSAREELDKSDFRGALTEAREAADKAKAMAADALGKKEQWQKSWKELNESIPKTMEAVRYRAALYSSKGVRLPEGVDHDVVDAAKAQYEELKAKWAEATSEAARGNLRDAIEKGTGVKEGLEKLKEMLHIKS